MRKLRGQILLFGELDASLDVAHRVEIFVELALVAVAQIAVEA